MGKGRDKQKKRDRNNPEKQAKKAEKQAAKQQKHVDRTERKAAECDEEDVEKMVLKLRTHETGTISVAEVAQEPSERVNATLVAHPLRDTTHLLLFGGEFWNGVKTTTYNDLFCYNIQKKEWRCLVIHGAMPQPRSAHQSVCYKHHMIVFGGEFTAPSQNQFHHYKDTWRLSCRENSYEWVEIPQGKGAVTPPPRSGHRMVLWKNKVVVFGGFFDTTAELRYYDDVWVASNLESNLTWAEEVPQTGALPPPRSGHCLACHNDVLLLYGGFSTDRDPSSGHTTSKCHNDMWEFNLATSTWTQIKKAGIPPAIRSGMSLVHRPGGKAYAFGGVFDGDEGDKLRSKFFNDLFMLNLDTRRFFPMTLRKKKAPVAGHTSTARDRREGGVDADLLANAATLGGQEDDDEMDEAIDHSAKAAPSGSGEESTTVRMTHIEIAPGVSVPCPRFNSMMCQAGQTLFIYGGQVEEGNREITFADMYSLNLNRMETYDILMQMDITKQPWYDPDGDWETQLSGASRTSKMTGLAQTEEDSGSDSRSDLSSSEEEEGEGDKEGDEAPALVPASAEDRAPLTAEALSAAQRAPRVKATSKGAQRLEELLAQLNESDHLPTPVDGENAQTFFTRTKAAWEQVVLEHNAETGARMSVSDAFVFARRRFDEIAPILDQIAYLKVEEEDRRRKEQRGKKE